MNIFFENPLNNKPIKLINIKILFLLIIVLNKELDKINPIENNFIFFIIKIKNNKLKKGPHILIIKQIKYCLVGGLLNLFFF